MTKFKVGDFIKGTPEASRTYCYTTEKMRKAEVIYVHSTDERIRLVVVEHDESRLIGREFDVDARYFELYDNLRSKVVAGRVVKYRDGNYRLVIPTEEGTLLLCGDGGATFDCYWKNDLTIGIHGFKDDLDIVEIWSCADIPRSAMKASTDDRKLIWKEEAAVKELTMEDVARLAGIPVSQLKIKK